MGDGSLTFVVPVRDPRGVADWTAVRLLMEATFNSLAGAGGQVVVAATRGTPLPALPPGSVLVELDIGYTSLPAIEGPERHQAVRRDKGARLLAGLMAVRPRGHVMVVDYDDFVSKRLAALVAAHPKSPGWYVDRGYVYDGGPLVFEQSTGFNGMCGTSLIVRADLLRLPSSIHEVDPRWAERSLGSHIFLRDDLEMAGTPLTPMPFAGAVYRIGHRDSTSPTSRIWRRYLSAGRAVGRPRQWLADVAHLRCAAAIREEFMLPT